MIKVDIVNEVSRVADITKVKAEVAVDAVFDAMRVSMQRGERIELRGFGVFQVKPRKRGIGRNPRTGKEVRIPPGRTIRFKPGKTAEHRVTIRDDPGLPPPHSCGTRPKFQDRGGGMPWLSSSPRRRGTAPPHYSGSRLAHATCRCCAPALPGLCIANDSRDPRLHEFGTTPAAIMTSTRRRCSSSGSVPLTGTWARSSFASIPTKRMLFDIGIAGPIAGFSLRPGSSSGFRCRGWWSTGGFTGVGAATAAFNSPRLVGLAARNYSSTPDSIWSVVRAGDGAESVSVGQLDGDISTRSWGRSST
jgi:DNA-binding protein HU-beta